MARNSTARWSARIQRGLKLVAALWLLTSICRAQVPAPAEEKPVPSEEIPAPVEGSPPEEHIKPGEPRQISSRELRPLVVQSLLGVMRDERPLPVMYMREELDFNTSKIRVAFVTGLEKSSNAPAILTDAFLWVNTEKAAHDFRQRYLVSAAICEGLNTKRPPGGDPPIIFPPKEKAYDGPTNPEAIYLWRWIGMHAPDLVVEVRKGDKLVWEIPETEDATLQAVGKLLNAQPLKGEGELASALMKFTPCETGTIPALRVFIPRKNDDSEWVSQLLTALDEAKFTGPSPARVELQRRVKRTPLEVATELAKIYGQDLKEVQYIPAVALIARVRLGQLTGNEKQLADVERIVAPYYSGEKKIVIKDGSGIAGHLIFTELARVTDGVRRQRYMELAQAAADLAFDAEGNPREAMPFHQEMSDALFMSGPLLAQVGELTGELRYYDACWRHLSFMRKLVLRRDGLYRHSPLGDIAWGRGNGFPALGLAMCIPHYAFNAPFIRDLNQAQQEHLGELLRKQDATGCWHQVIDNAGSYRELTATAMIGYAMSRIGDEQRYGAALEKAWYAVNSRIGRDGRLVDVCTGTGKFKTLRDYLDRPAILGQDARGGAMALLFAVEMAEREAWKKENEWK
jgi:unsaturated rhamnogalacturonyl hydrolase